VFTVICPEIRRRSERPKRPRVTRRISYERHAPKTRAEIDKAGGAVYAGEFRVRGKKKKGARRRRRRPYREPFFRDRFVTDVTFYRFAVVELRRRRSFPCRNRPRVLAYLTPTRVFPSRAR